MPRRPLVIYKHELDRLHTHIAKIYDTKRVTAYDATSTDALNKFDYA